MSQNQIDQLKQALISQEAYKDTKTIKDRMLAGESEAFKITITTISSILDEKKSTSMSKLMALRLAKETMEIQNYEFIRLFATEILYKLKPIALFRKEDKSDARGKFYFSSEPSKQEAQIGNSFFRLVLDSIYAWSIWYQVDPLTGQTSLYKKFYDELISQGVNFPKLSYYKQEELQKKLMNQSDVIARAPSESKPPQSVALHKAQTVNIPANQQNNKNIKQQLNELIINIQLEQELIGDLLQSVENDEEMMMLSECNQNFIKFKQQSEQMLENLIESDFNGKELEELLSKQEFLSNFIQDFALWKSQKMTFDVFKQKQIIHCNSTPNPEQTPNPDAIKQKQDEMMRIEQEQQQEQARQEQLKRQEMERIAAIKRQEEEKQILLKRQEEERQQALKKKQEEQEEQRKAKLKKEYEEQQAELKRKEDERQIEIKRLEAQKKQEEEILRQKELQKQIQEKEEEQERQRQLKKLEEEKQLQQKKKEEEQIRQNLKRQKDLEQLEKAQEFTSNLYTKTFNDQQIMERQLLSDLEIDMKEQHQVEKKTTIYNAQNYHDKKSLEEKSDSKKMNIKLQVPKQNEQDEWEEQALENEGSVNQQKHLSASASHSNNFTFNSRRQNNLKQIDEEDFPSDEQNSQKPHKINQNFNYQNEIPYSRQESTKLSQNGNSIHKLQEENKNLKEELRKLQEEANRMRKQISDLNRSNSHNDNQLVETLTKQNEALAQQNAILIQEKKLQQTKLVQLENELKLTRQNSVTKEFQTQRNSSQNLNVIKTKLIDPSKNNSSTWIQASDVQQPQRRSIRSESLGFSQIKQDEFPKQLFSRVGNQNQGRKRIVSLQLNQHYQDLIFPYTDPKLYYKDRIVKPIKGRQVVTNLDVFQGISQKDAFKLAVLKGKQCLFNSKNLAVGSIVDTYYLNGQKQVKLDLYYINQNKQQQIIVAMNYLFTQELIVQTYELENNFILTGEKQLKQELIFQLNQNCTPFPMQSNQMQIRKNQNKQEFHEVYLPITIMQFIEYEKVRLQDYKKGWKSNLPNILKSTEIKLNPKMVVEPEDIQLHLKELIELNQHKRDDFLAGIDELKYGGLWKLKQNKFLARFIISPIQEMVFQIVQVQGKKDIRLAEYIINTVIFIFSN